jgi:hypothetical protein
MHRNYIKLELDYRDARKHFGMYNGCEYPTDYDKPPLGSVLNAILLKKQIQARLNGTQDPDAIRAKWKSDKKSLRS